MTRLNVLKGKMREKGETYASCAKEIGISTTSFCEKINGKRKFSVEEASLIARYLKLSDQEKIYIFLT